MFLASSKSLFDTANRLFPVINSSAKPKEYWKIYDQYFPPHKEVFDLIEIGVFEGVSTKILSSYYKRSRILAIDKEQKNLDFSENKNVSFAQCDQADRLELLKIASNFSSAPQIIIDDASHIGGLTLHSFDTLFPILKPGGIYVIEDWSVGYHDNFPDGAPLPERTTDDSIYQQKQFNSHNYGLVGVVKMLIDRMGYGDLVESVHVHKWTVLIKKSE